MRRHIGRVPRYSEALPGSRGARACAAVHMQTRQMRTCHVCTGTWLGPCHICTGTWLGPCHICTGTGRTGERLEQRRCAFAEGRNDLSPDSVGFPSADLVSCADVFASKDWMCHMCLSPCFKASRSVAARFPFGMMSLCPFGMMSLCPFSMMPVCRTPIALPADFTNKLTITHSVECTFESPQ